MVCGIPEPTRYYCENLILRIIVQPSEDRPHWWYEYHSRWELAREPQTCPAESLSSESLHRHHWCRGRRVSHHPGPPPDYHWPRRRGQRCSHPCGWWSLLEHSESSWSWWPGIGDIHHWQVWMLGDHWTLAWNSFHPNFYVFLWWHLLFLLVAFKIKVKCEIARVLNLLSPL